MAGIFKAKGSLPVFPYANHSQMASHPRSLVSRHVSPLPRSLQVLLPASWSTGTLMEGSSTKIHHARRQAPDSESEALNEQRQGPGHIHVLPDDVLLYMFSCYMVKEREYFAKSHTWWHTLIHVCGRWRAIVLASPRRLNLHILYTSRRPVKEMLDTWPALPIVISNAGHPYGLVTRGLNTDSIISAFEHNDRVRGIDLHYAPNQLLQEFATLLPEPFPVLTFLMLSSRDQSPPVIPESFLGASAPCLRHLHLDGVPFPAMWKLLFSARDLVTLELWGIPHSGYISPEVMVTCLSATTNLTKLRLQFLTPRPCPNRARRLPPPLTRVSLAALGVVVFRGISEYLEDLISQIDAPVLHEAEIRFFNQLIFDIPQFPQFIYPPGRFGTVNHADIVFAEDFVKIQLIDSQCHIVADDYPRVELTIACRQPDWQPYSLAQICTSSFPLLFALECLVIHKHPHHLHPRWQDVIESTDWLELLQLFTAVKDLRLPETLAQCVAAALKELPAERAMGVMPALQKIYTHGPSASRAIEENLEQFVIARQLIGHPVTIHHRQRR